MAAVDREGYIGQLTRTNNGPYSPFSPNLDNRSFRLNFEVVAAFYGGSCVADLASAFETDLKHANRQKRLEAKSPFAKRLLDSVARLLAPQL